ncbi:polyisoprenoid-binding protein [Arthrobacter livingstonensis]|uniref:Polyisoprenoid-binding protein n=1 Tax=Arthrobacter livingstonensis TaxID=670078 RepID=A0A2V5LFB0_9MICC|nr:YceI family protein [Arthrobacter livingstonensis]PYI69762.1 polyisoprenoid-binding protein [Arthrobacter livingstonensis]
MSSETVAPELSGDYVFDVVHSRLGFVARHAMITKVHGSFKEFEGHLHIDAEEPTRSSGRLSIVTESIDTGTEQRDNHLRSNDFFDMPNYPQITFESTAIEHASGENYQVIGDLAIKGVSRAVTLDVQYTGSSIDPSGNTRIGFEAAVTINRKDWGLNWNAPLEAGGVLVSEKVTLEIDISAIRQ